jgi:hypothetical protein
LKKSRQYNGQKDKQWLTNTTQKTKYWATQTPEWCKVICFLCTYLTLDVRSFSILPRGCLYVEVSLIHLSFFIFKFYSKMSYLQCTSLMTLKITKHSLLSNRVFCCRLFFYSYKWPVCVFPKRESDSLCKLQYVEWDQLPSCSNNIIYCHWN